MASVLSCSILLLVGSILGTLQSSQCIVIHQAGRSRIISRSHNSDFLSKPRNLSHRDFLRLVTASAKTGRSLQLRGRSVDLEGAEIKVSGDQPLSILGPGIIRGHGHTLFQIGGNRQKVNLVSLDLIHKASPLRSEKSRLGAAVWCRGKSSMYLEKCSISSEAGYAVWLVQRAQLEANSSVISDCGRSGITGFGNGYIDLHRCIIQRATLHGVCVRGKTVVRIKDSRIQECGLRGIYAYHNASLTISSSTVTGTRGVSSSAIQVEALRDEDRACLEMTRCVVQDNAGFGLSVAGNVELSLDASVNIDSHLSATDQMSTCGVPH